MIKGVTFNNKHSRQFHLAILSTKRPLLPETKDEYLDIPGGSGSILISDSSPKDVIVSIEFLLTTPEGANIYQLARNIGQWLWTTNRTSLIFDDDIAYVYQAKVTGEIILEKIIEFGRFTVNFRCKPPTRS